MDRGSSSITDCYSTRSLVLSTQKGSLTPVSGEGAFPPCLAAWRGNAPSLLVYVLTSLHLKNGEGLNAQFANI